MMLIIISYALISSAIYDMLQAINKSVYDKHEDIRFSTFKDCVKQATRQYNISLFNECLHQADRDYCLTHRCGLKKSWVL